MFNPSNMSHVTCHMSHVIFFRTKWWLIGGGSVINEAYPVQFVGEQIFGEKKNLMLLLLLYIDKRAFSHFPSDPVSTGMSSYCRRNRNNKLKLIQKKLNACLIRLRTGFTLFCCIGLRRKKIHFFSTESFQYFFLGYSQLKHI